MCCDITTEFGERNIGLEIFQVAAQNLHDPNTALHCSAAAPIVVAAYNNWRPYIKLREAFIR